MQAMKEFFTIPRSMDIKSRRLEDLDAHALPLTWPIATTCPDVREGDLVTKYGQYFTWSPLHKVSPELACPCISLNALTATLSVMDMCRHMQSCILFAMSVTPTLMQCSQSLILLHTMMSLACC